MLSFIETKLFTRLVQTYLTDDEYRKLQALLIDNPRLGRSSAVRAASGSSAGEPRVEVSAAATA
jgi:hypothetical protein